MTKPQGPSPLEKELFLLGKLSEAERARLDASWPTEQRVAFLREHAELSEQLVTRNSPGQFAARVRQRAQAESPRSSPPVAGWVVAAAACLAAVAFVGRGMLPDETAQQAPPTEGAQSVRPKGLTPSLRAYRKTEAGAERLNRRALADAGDVLQLGYVAPGVRHGVIVSIDGRAHVTLLFPESPTASTQLPRAAGEHLLNHAYELDDAPVFERFVLVTSPSPLRVPEVLSAAEAIATRPKTAQTAPLALPPEINQSSLLLLKRGP